MKFIFARFCFEALAQIEAFFFRLHSPSSQQVLLIKC